MPHVWSPPTERSCGSRAPLRRGHALLERVEEVEQLIALPDPTPLPLVETLEDARLLELLKGVADGHVRLARELLSSRSSASVSRAATRPFASSSARYLRSR